MPAPAECSRGAWPAGERLAARQVAVAGALCLGALLVAGLVFNGVLPPVPQSMSSQNAFLVGTVGAAALLLAWLRPPALVWGGWLAGAVAASAAAWALWPEGGIASAAALGGGASALVAMALLGWKGPDALARRARDSAWVSANLIAFVLLSPWALDLTAAVHAAVFDPAAFVADLGAGFSPSFAAGQLFAAVSWLRDLSSAIYLGLPWALAIVIAEERRRGPGRMDLATTFVVMGLAASAVYLAFPVVGPIFAYPDAWPDHLPAITTDGSTVRDRVFALAPRNCMPSLHTAWVMALAWHAARLGRAWGGAAALFAALTLLATLGLGAHYAVDLLAGICFAAAVHAGLWSPLRWRWAAVGAGLMAAWFALVWGAAGWLAAHPLWFWGLAGASVALAEWARRAAEAEPAVPGHPQAPAWTLVWTYLPGHARRLALSAAAAAGAMTLALVAGPWTPDGPAGGLALIPGLLAGIAGFPDRRAAWLAGAAVWAAFPVVGPAWLDALGGGTAGAGAWGSGVVALAILPWAAPVGAMLRVAVHGQEQAVARGAVAAIGALVGGLSLVTILGEVAPIAMSIAGVTLALVVPREALCQRMVVRVSGMGAAMAGGAVGGMLVLMRGLAPGGAEQVVWVVVAGLALTVGWTARPPASPVRAVMVLGTLTGVLAVLTPDLTTQVALHAQALAGHPFATAEASRAVLRGFWGGVVLLPWACLPGAWVWAGRPPGGAQSTASLLGSVAAITAPAALVTALAAHPAAWVVALGALGSAWACWVGLLSRARLALAGPVVAGVAVAIAPAVYPDGPLASGALVALGPATWTPPSRASWTGARGVVAAWPDRGGEAEGIDARAIAREAVALARPWLEGLAVRVWGADALVAGPHGATVSCFELDTPACPASDREVARLATAATWSQLEGHGETLWSPWPAPPWLRTREGFQRARAALGPSGRLVVTLALDRLTTDELASAVAAARISFPAVHLGWSPHRKDGLFGVLVACAQPCAAPARPGWVAPVALDAWVDGRREALGAADAGELAATWSDPAHALRAAPAANMARLEGIIEVMHALTAPR